jgi:phosphoribosylformylglycinamidine synthase PurS subunit
MKYRWGVKIMPREVILDSQGRAIEESLKLQKLNVEQCRVGRFVELMIPGNELDSKNRAEEIAKKMLHNPLIENYSIEKLSMLE